MDESGGSESALVGSGSSSQAKDEMINFLHLFAEGDRLAAITKYMKHEQTQTQTRERTEQERIKLQQQQERTKQMHIQV
jgi:hypothetical protein